MQYRNLNFLLLNSSSSRHYFMSLPNDVQLKLRDRKDFIHTQFELRRNAEYMVKNP